MIPKLIHYCWFGNQEIPEVYARYIASWKEIMPDYKFKLWNESNSPMDLAYMQVAREAKCWANLSNYTRLHAVYHDGGIYLDTDVEILKSLNPLLEMDCFFGFESTPESDRLVVNNAIFGAIPGQPFIAECKAHLLANFPGSEPANLSAPELVTHLLIQKGLRSYGAQKVEEVNLLERDYFYPHGWKEEFSPQAITQKTFAVHHWGKSWWSGSSRHPRSRATQGHKKGKSRILLSIYKRSGLDGVKLFRSGIVRYGPFRGMKFESLRRKPDTFARLIGCYNDCIHEFIYEVMDQNYNKIIVSGCSEGYYAVGLARMFPNAKVFAYSDNPVSLSAVDRNVKANLLSQRIVTGDSTSIFDSFSKEHSGSRILILSASENVTRQLLKQEHVSYLSKADVIAAIPSTGAIQRSQLLKDFESSHDLKIVRQTPLPVPVVQYLESSKSGQKLLNRMDGKRLKMSEWVLMRCRPGSEL